MQAMEPEIVVKKMALGMLESPHMMRSIGPDDGALVTQAAGRSRIISAELDLSSIGDHQAGECVVTLDQALRDRAVLVARRAERLNDMPNMTEMLHRYAMGGLRMILVASLTPRRR